MQMSFVCNSYSASTGQAEVGKWILHSCLHRTAYLIYEFQSTYVLHPATSSLQFMQNLMVLRVREVITHAFQGWRGLTWKCSKRMCPKSWLQCLPSHVGYIQCWCTLQNETAASTCGITSLWSQHCACYSIHAHHLWMRVVWRFAANPTLFHK